MAVKPINYILGSDTPLLRTEQSWISAVNSNPVQPSASSGFLGAGYSGNYDSDNLMKASPHASLSVLVTFEDGSLGYWINNGNITNNSSTQGLADFNSKLDYSPTIHGVSALNNISLRSGCGIFDYDVINNSIDDSFITSFKNLSSSPSPYPMLHAVEWRYSTNPMANPSSAGYIGANNYPYVDQDGQALGGGGPHDKTIDVKWPSINSFNLLKSIGKNKAQMVRYPIVLPSAWLSQTTASYKKIKYLTVYIETSSAAQRVFPTVGGRQGYSSGHNNGDPNGLHQGNVYYSVDVNTFGIGGLTRLVNAQATMVASHTEVILPYSLTTKNTSKTPDFKWDFLNAQHIFQYWSQTGLYGFGTTKDADGKYLPTNYIGLSDIDNPTYLPANKLLDVYTKDNAPITLVTPWRDNLVVFTPTTTSMFVGRLAQTQQLINANVGVPAEYNKTVQVVSNSIVFKNSLDVFAFVPSSGTDDAESLTVRNISKQITSKLQETETETKNSLEYHISSVTYNNDEYWLVYGNKSLNKTTIFKYSWSKFCWIIDEYPVYLEDFMKTSEHKIMAVDNNAVVYNLLSDEWSQVAPTVGASYEQFHEMALPIRSFIQNNTTSANSETSRLILDLIDLAEVYTENIILGNGELIHTNKDMLSAVHFNELVPGLRAIDISNFPEELKIPLDWLTNLLDTMFITIPISISLKLGARKPMFDTHTMIDEITVSVGVDSQSRSAGTLKAEIITDGLKFSEMDLIAQSGARVISSEQEYTSSASTWSINESLYERPAATKKTKKVMKMADAVDVAIEGSVISPVYIDGISISYRQTGRKKF